MNSQIKIARIILVSLGVLGVISLVNYIGVSVFAIRYITYNFDERLSLAARATIKNYVDSCQSNGYYNTRAIIDEIPAHCASIKSLSLLQLPHHTAQLSVTLYDPVIAINADKILIENSSIISAAHYADYVKNGLYAMNISDKVPALFPAEFTTCITNAIQEKLFDHYTFNIASQHEWYLHDKQDPAFTVCCNAASVPLGLMHEKYTQLKKQIRQTASLKTAWIADVRFQNQIVLSMSTRGHYGKGI